MDPIACLRRALEALAESDAQEAFDALSDYFTWRKRSGYEPERMEIYNAFRILTPGDSFADMLAGRLAEIMAARMIGAGVAS